MWMLGSVYWSSAGVICVVLQCIKGLFLLSLLFCPFSSREARIALKLLFEFTVVFFHFAYCNNNTKYHLLLINSYIKCFISKVSKIVYVSLIQFYVNITALLFKLHNRIIES